MSRMLRALVVGILAVSTMAACGSKHDAPQVDPTAPAGKVLEVSGKVTVGTKALAVGDTIKANDLIETGADGSVVIQLAHNDARWELGPNHKSKPSESQAWTAERSSGPAKPVEQDTSAAGRPAERSAADTSTSVGHGESAAAASKADTDVKETARGGKDTGGGGPSTGSPAPGAAPSPPAAVATPPPPPPMAEPAPAPSKQVAPPAKPRSIGKAPKDSPKNDDAKVEDAKPDAIHELANLSSCLVKDHPVTIKVHIAKHVPTITFVGNVDAQVKSCITSAAKKLSLPIESGDMALTLTK